MKKTNLLLSKNKDLEKKIKHNISNEVNFSDILSNGKNLGDVKIVLHDLKDYSGDLKTFADQFRNQIKNDGILILSSNSDNKVSYVCSVTDNVINEIDAIKICKEIGNIINGGGGGKPHLATAGGKNNNDTDKVFDHIFKYVESQLMKG